jgi:hypothetical protein
MLSLYVHGVSWNLTRKEPTGRRGAGVGNGNEFKLQSPRTRHTARHCWVTRLGLVGRPLARIRGEEGKDSKEGQEKVMRVSLVL